MMSSFDIPSRHSLCGLRMIIVSIMLIGALSVAVFARPALPKTFSTSGRDLIILSWTCNKRFASLFEMSGKVTGMNNREPSSKGGMNSVPRLMTNGTLPSTNANASPSVNFFHLRHHLIVGPYSQVKNLLIGCLLSGRSEERRVGKECRLRWSQDD